ncbi:MAG: family 43 glycosylhydrolase [Prevotellaceae bacterium]|nr:family 43 glycosylhydrolase [Candidatus Minthosoma caballi]
MTNKLLLASALCLSLSGNAFAQKTAKNVSSQPKDPNEKVAFLFTYFTGNAPEEEQICYALSEDGYDYTLLNQGLPVIKSDTIAYTQCVRDPHILRGEDGKTFYMVVTDMKSSLGWASNRGLVLMKSTDLIHWTHSAINFPTKYPKQWKNVTRVWAPETIYDHKAGKYMVFYSLLTNDGKCQYDKIFYSYVNDDFTDLEGEPKWLFDAGNATIDGDIVYNEKDQMYHLFYKQESGRGIFQAVAKNLTDKWQMIDGHVEQTNEAVEGVGVCKSLDGNSWVVMYDCYGSGHYQFCKSEDLKTFTKVKDTKTRGKFTPRHGTIMPITQAEKDRLLAEWGDGKNPILPDFHADPEVLHAKKDGKFYIYSTTDGTPGWGGYKFNVFSSQNLIDWTDEGTMLDAKSDQVSWATGNAWAPCIIEKKVGKNYKYYFYYSAHNPKTNRKEIGCAIADDPKGPFVDCGHPIITDEDRPEGVRGGQAIDVDVFQDPKSGKFYLYWGNGFMAGAELNDDMISIKKETAVDLTPKGGTLKDYAYREGTYVFFRKGVYYFLWSVDDTGADNYHVAYGTAKNPLGPITVAEEPVILQQDPANKIYGTAHNSVLQVNGKDEWYVVYHRINPNFRERQLSPGTHRQVCIDKMTFDKSGKINVIKPTHEGPSPLKK